MEHLPSPDPNFLQGGPAQSPTRFPAPVCPLSFSLGSDHSFAFFCRYSSQGCALSAGRCHLFPMGSLILHTCLSWQEVPYSFDIRSPPVPF